MSKGAANEQRLGGLHDTLARVFQRVLERYEKNYEALDQMQKEEVSDEMVELLSTIQEPNPAMLSAVSKFLKDNDIMYDTEEVNKLSAQERRLKEKRERRGNVVSFSDMPLVENE